ncbi:MAG: ABC transporter ATP-binding protein [Sphaerochaetaceae bacterium]|nr:ABC transporter ATP-binding protein [Sphaerochaetaceae bacterium]
MNAIDVKDLHGGYEKTEILHGLSLSVSQGTFTAVIGPNGCGKSTLLKHIFGELAAFSGNVSIQGQSIGALKQNELARMVSFVGQKSDFAGDFTVKDIVSLGRYCHGDEASSSSVIEKSMEMVGISHLKNRTVNSLSGGEYQLAMISRALCQDTPIMLLDEITNNLDPKHEIQILKLLRNLSDSGKTIVCIMHNLNQVLSYSDNTVILKDGCVYECGKTDSVLTENNIEKVFDVTCSIIHADGRQLLTVY